MPSDIEVCIIVRPPFHFHVVCSYSIEVAARIPYILHSMLLHPAASLCLMETVHL